MSDGKNTDAIVAALNTAANIADQKQASASDVSTIINAALSAAGHAGVPAPGVALAIALANAAISAHASVSDAGKTLEQKWVEMQSDLKSAAQEWGA